MDNANRVIKSLWIGKHLSPIEQLSLNSYLNNGHKVELYIYDNIDNVPPSVIIKDANLIIPRAEIFSISVGPHINSFAIFADYFRYKLLYELGGWWSDLDAVCLKPYDFDQEYLFINEKTRDFSGRIASGIIKCPPHSAIMRYCFETTEGIINSNHVDKWGITGPKLLEKAVSKFNLQSYSVPYEYFIPIGYFEIEKLISRKTAISEITTFHNAYSIHIFNSMWDVNNYPRFGFFPKNSIYETLKRNYGIKNTVGGFINELFSDLLNYPIKLGIKKIANKLYLGSNFL